MTSTDTTDPLALVVPLGLPRSTRRAAHRIGRPRDPVLTQRLLSAALALVAEQGLHHFNVDTLVATAGAGKAAVYRRWPDTEVLLAEAVRQSRLIPAAPDTGSLRGDLIVVLGPFTRVLDRDELAVGALLGRAQHSSELRTAVEAAVVDPLVAVLATVVRRHVRRGHLVPGPHEALLRRLVLALWWERLTTAPAPSTAAEVEALVDRALLPALSG